MPQLSDRPTRGDHPDTVFLGGRILTMDGPAPAYVEAVAISGGRITAVGSAADIRASHPGAVVRDLEGATLLPGLIDAHSHFSSGFEMVNQVNVAGAPVGPSHDFASLLQTLAGFVQKRGISAGGWVIGWGYDQETLAEKRHLTRTELDAALPDHKVVLVHVSAHGAVLNSAALAAVGIDATTSTPAGGVIARLPGTTEPAGLLMETAYLSIADQLPRSDPESRFELLDQVQQLYASNGYTHAQDGFTPLADLDFFRTAADRGLLSLDLVALGSFLDAADWVGHPDFPIAEYDNGFRIAGMKVILDGSPQGGTAAFTTPYLHGAPGDDPSWKGEPTVPFPTFDIIAGKALAAGVPLFVHVNGDAAIDGLIAAVRAAGVTAADDRRTVAIHSQFQRPDHLLAYRELGITPSYFTNHAFFWGDVHRHNRSPEQASFLSPLHAATEAGLVVSNHSDFPVTPLDPFFILWTAMARTTRSGTTLGPDQRVDAYTALQALTTGPAFQIFEEDRKGRIAPGLLADFVILTADPLEVDLDRVRDLRVLETIKEGVTIHRASDTDGPNSG